MIRIDQPTSLKKAPPDYDKTRTFYPDLMLIRGGSIDHLIDVKTDIGWGRETLPNSAERHRKDVMRARGSTVQLRDGEDKSSHPYRFSEELTYDIILISAGNVNGETLNAGIEGVRRLNPIVDIFVLSRGEHPNSYRYSERETVSKAEIDHGEFVRLRERVCKPKRGIVGSLFGRRG